MSMSLAVKQLFDADNDTSSSNGLYVSLAASPAEVRAAQRLRFDVFTREMGARFEDVRDHVDEDRFDAFCHHLLVRDATNHHRVVGCYRLLTDREARKAGGFYSETEFDLTRVLALPGRFLEVGRTCVHPDYRTGGVIALLWSGLARFLVMNKIDYLMGCASIPLRAGTDEARAVYQQLSERFLSDENTRVFPRVALPSVNPIGATKHVSVPPLIKSYLRMGAKICGEPAWDPQFNVADVFMLLHADAITSRYARHFVKRADRPWVVSMPACPAPRRTHAACQYRCHVVARRVCRRWSLYVRSSRLGKCRDPLVDARRTATARCRQANAAAPRPFASELSYRCKETVRVSGVHRLTTSWST